MASYDGPPPMKRVRVKVPFPNHVGHATKVFAIHMGVLLVACILIGIFWEMTAMWVCGGLLSFFMIGWHLNAMDSAICKDREWEPYEDKYVEA